MSDKPYTDAALGAFQAELDSQLGPYVQVDTWNLAEALLEHLAAAGLLITPRIQRDTEWFGRAYIYTRPDGKQLVLDPQHVTVVLPQEAP